MNDNKTNEVLSQPVVLRPTEVIQDQVADSSMYISQQGIGIYKAAESSRAQHLPFPAPRNLTPISVTFSTGPITGPAGGTWVIIGGTSTTRFDVAKLIADEGGNLATQNFLTPDFLRTGAQLNDANIVANGVPYGIGNISKVFPGLFRFGFINEMFLLSKEKMVLKVSSTTTNLVGQVYRVYAFNGSAYSLKINELALANDQNSFNNNVTVVSLPYDVSGFSVYAFLIPNAATYSFTAQVVDCPVLA